MEGRRRHQFILHAPDATAAHCLQEGLPETRRDLGSNVRAQMLCQRCRQLLSGYVDQAPHLQAFLRGLLIEQSCTFAELLSVC